MIVIHFGLRKAASSSIQQFLKANQTYLRSLGYDYAPIGHLSGQSHLNLTNDARKLSNFDPNGGTLSDVRKYWKRNKGKVLIISSEILEGSTQKNVCFIQKRLSRADNLFLPLLIIRDLASLVASSYSQHAKMNGIEEFDSYFARFLQRPRVHYYDTAKKWANAFGWDSIRVRLLDRDFLINGDLIDDFISTAGLEMSPEEIAQLERPRESNVSPGWRVAEALRALYDGRHELPDGHPLLGQVNGDRDGAKSIRARAESLGTEWDWNSDKGRYLTTEQAQACLDIYRRSIDALNAHLASPLPRPKTLEEKGFIPREFTPDISRIPAKDLRQFYDELGEMPTARRLWPKMAQA
jgi:hypothetical protein